jgi:hypothetical protein
MKFRIRKSVFETNSSNTHSLTICTKKEYEEFEKGLRVYDYYNDKLIALSKAPVEEVSDDEDEENSSAYKTFEQFWDYVGDSGFDSYDESFTTPSGDEMVAFGYYGRD